MFRNEEERVRCLVISKEGKPLDPTKRAGKVRRLLKNGHAKVVYRKPFTIQLLVDTTTYTKKYILGVDSGYQYLGLSVVSDKEEVFSAELELLQGQVERNTKDGLIVVSKKSITIRSPSF